MQDSRTSLSELAASRSDWESKRNPFVTGRSERLAEAADGAVAGCRQNWSQSQGRSECCSGVLALVRADGGNNEKPARSDFGHLPRPAHFDLKSTYGKRGLQVIVKLANIQLTPEKPEYEGGTWHVEGQMNEHIVVTALYPTENLQAVLQHRVEPFNLAGSTQLSTAKLSRSSLSTRTSRSLVLRMSQEWWWETDMASPRRRQRLAESLLNLSKAFWKMWTSQTLGLQLMEERRDFLATPLNHQPGSYSRCANNR